MISQPRSRPTSIAPPRTERVPVMLASSSSPSTQTPVGPWKIASVVGRGWNVLVSWTNPPIATRIVALLARCSDRAGTTVVPLVRPVRGCATQYRAGSSRWQNTSGWGGLGICPLARSERRRPSVPGRARCAPSASGRTSAFERVSDDEPRRIASRCATRPTAHARSLVGPHTSTTHRNGGAGVRQYRWC